MKQRHAIIRCASAALAISGMVAAAQPAYCWDKFAHEVIAQIAYEHLKPAVKAQCDRLIDAMASDQYVVALAPQFKPYNFVTAAAWMDDIKTVSHVFNSWHYIDLPIDGPLTSAQVAAFRDSNPSNAVEAIETFCEPSLTNPNAPLAVRARALGFFLHIAGDLHQPLHAVGIDRGGNTYAVAQLPSADPTWPIVALHPFWDSAYRYSGAGGTIAIIEPAGDLPRITAPGQDPVRSFAAELEKDYAPSDPSLARDDNCADWALESRNIAATFVYPALDGGHVLTPQYVRKAHDIACRRLVLAGLRIADTLNHWLGSKQ